MSRNDLVDGLASLLAKTGPVELRETSKSWLFLTRDEVFKLKKRVRDDLQDLTSLRARHDNTLAEIDLNRRLAPGAYLGAVRVGRLRDGTLVLDRTDAATVDWLVRMHRLPTDRMLDRQIADQAPRSALAERLDGLVPLLAAFYAAAPSTRLTAAELMTVHESQLDAAREVLLNPHFPACHAPARKVLGRLDALWPAIASALERRVRQGAIVEGHGDLRPEHVCLTDAPLIYDCLEFNRTLRLSDPFGELAFLALECSALGADWIGPRLVEALEPALGPRPDALLLNAYAALHAVLRARLCLAHLLQPVPRLPEKWMPAARWYLDTALHHLDQADASRFSRAAKAGAAETSSTDEL